MLDLTLIFIFEWQREWEDWKNGHGGKWDRVKEKKMKNVKGEPSKIFDIIN